MIYRIQSHTHTIYSKRTSGRDSSISLQLARKYKFFNNVVDAFVITDHEDDLTRDYHRFFEEIEKWKKEAEEYGVTVISGIEAECEEGHLLGIGVDEKIMRRIGKDRSATNVSRVMKDAGAFVVIPHPFDPLSYGMGVHILRGMKVYCHAVEVHNSPVILEKPNMYAEALANWMGVYKIVGGDVHDPRVFEFDRIEVDAKDRSEESLVEAMKRGRFSIMDESVRAIPLSLMKDMYLDKIILNQDYLRTKIKEGWPPSKRHPHLMMALNNPLIKPWEQALLEVGVRNKESGVWDLITMAFYAYMVGKDKYNRHVKYKELYEILEPFKPKPII